MLGQVDRLGLRAENGHTRILQLLGQPERGLAAKSADDSGNPAGPLLGVDDFEDVFEGERFEVEPVGGVVVGRNGLRVAVDHDGLVAGFAQGETA